MKGWRGVLSGVLGLVALQVVVATPASAGRVGSGLNDVASLLRRALSPAVPLLPDLRSSPASAAPASEPTPAAGARSTQAKRPAPVGTVSI